MQKLRCCFCFVVLELFQGTGPLFWLEADKHKTIPYYQRAFDKHTVCGKQMQLFILGHGGQFVLQGKGFIFQAARVKKAAQRQTAAGVPFFQFIIGGVLL